MNIRRLPRELADKIAAGEVIERPASVVKELIENAIDAFPTKINVQILHGGKTRIVVQDDGSGINCEDLELAVERHATSKLETENDLMEIRTLGYRGEALSSISAVSRFEIRTRINQQTEGCCLRCEPGSPPVLSPINTPWGTRVQVDDLFFNLPARRKFLSSAIGEFRRISKLVKQFAVAYPETGFTLTSDGRDIFSSNAGNDRKTLLRKIWDNDGELRSDVLSLDDLAIESWYQPLEGRRLNIWTFVNRRIVNDSTLRSAVHSVNSKLSGNLVLFLQVPPGKIDVNIHPAKTEIRYRNNRDIFELTRRSVQQLLTQIEQITVTSGFTPSEGLSSETMKTSCSSDHYHYRNSFDSPVGLQNLFSRVSSPSFSDTRQNNILQQEGPEDLSGEIQDLSYMGQVSSGYLLFDGAGDLVIVDPHAAHERINFEFLREHLKDIDESQRLNPPIILENSISDLVRGYLEELEKWGFLFQEQDNGVFSLTAIPVILNNFAAGPQFFLESLLEDWENGRGSWIDNAILAKWASIACKRSIKLNQRVTPSEARELLNRLGKCTNPLFCPHGRPVLLKISEKELEKHFRRTE